MFKNDNQSISETIIGPSVHVDGDLSSQGNIVIEGSVTGTIATSGNLTVGEHAVINANVEATNAHFAGTLKGNLVVHERLELKHTSKITGDIATSVLVVDEGALLNGHCQMGQTSATSTVKSKKNPEKLEKAALES